MASGSQSMTTYYAKRIVGDASAAQANSALLQTGANVTADTWILNRTNRATTYGIKYVYDGTDGQDKIEFYGGTATASAWVQLDTGDTYIAGKLGINYNPETSGNNYQLYVNGNAYIYQANSNVSTQQAPGLRVNGKIDIYDNVTGGGVANSLLNILYNGTHDYGVPVKIHSYGGDSPAIRFSKSASIDDINSEVNTSWTVGMYYNSTDAFAITRGRGPAGWGTADLVINSSGNVGIGTTSPTYKLHVSGSSYFTDTITGDSLSTWHILGGRPSNTTNFNTYFETITNLHHDNPARTDAEISYNRFYLNHSDQTTYGPSALNLPVVDQHVLSFGIDNGAVYSRHIAFDIRTNAVYVRARTSSTWGNWEQLVRNTGTWEISIIGNAATATKLSNTPNNTTTFLRGDNTWTNTLTGIFYSTGSPGFQNVTAAGTWAYLQLKSGTLGWDIASISSQNSGALDFRPHKSTNHGIMISQDGGLYFRNPATDGIYYAGTKATHRMIRFIDNASDTYGNGIGIGGGGLVVIGAGESSDTLLSNLSLTSSGGTETTYITSDGSIEFYPSINGWDATARIWMTAGVLNIGLDGNSPRENSLNVYGGAGRIQLYSASSTTGNRGLWVPAHGSGSAKNIILIDTNNNITFNGNVTGNCSGSSGSCTGNAATATRINGNLGAISSATTCNIWVSSNASASGIPKFVSGVYVTASTGVITAKGFAGPLTGNVTGNCSGSAGSVAWANVTGKPNRAGSDSDGGPAQTVKGAYTAKGGQQNPNYFGKNKIGFLMMNTNVNNNSNYKDWIIMDCYDGNDVGGGVAFGVNRQALGAYIMRSAAARTSWAESAELIGTHNYASYCAKKTEAIKNITRSGTTFTATRCDGTTFTFTQQDNNTTYSFSDKNVTLAWGTKSTIATVGGTDIHVTMPANPNTNTWRPVQNNLTSTSTSDCLSAAQGKVLNDKINAAISSNVHVTYFSSNTTVANNVPCFFFLRGFSSDTRAGGIYQCLGGYDAVFIAGQMIGCTRSGNKYTFGCSDGSWVYGVKIEFTL